MFSRSRQLGRALHRHSPRPAQPRGRKLRIEPLEPRHLLNAAPTDILLPLASVLEQQPPGTPVGMFATADPDARNTFTYTLVSGKGSVDNASFTIDSLGDLLTASTFDFRAKSAYSIRVRSTDQGDLWFEKAFTVTVTQLIGRRVDLVSTALLSSTGNSPSYTVSISGHGRYVAFQSSASNLVSGDTNGVNDIFVRDMVSGITTRMSTDSASVQGNGDSYTPSISGDGRYVAFESSASNLVSGDTDGTSDVFVTDLISGVATRVSTSSSAAQGNSSSGAPSISSDGRYVAFWGYASNLVSDDTNAQPDVFVKDRVSGVTTRVSTSSTAIQGNNYSETPSISGHGRYVAFESTASNLVSGDTNGMSDIFVKDLVTGVTTRLSTDSSGVQGNSSSYAPSISHDGRHVAFWSYASNLVSGDTNGSGDVFVKDLVSGVTTRVSTDSSGVQGNSWSYTPSVSGDGRYVAFVSYASNLVSGDTNGSGDVFVKDLVSGVTTRVSTDRSAVQGNSVSWYPSLSGDGGHVAFSSFASNLVSGDTNGTYDIFVKDLTTGAIGLESARNAAGRPMAEDNGDSFYPSTSGDGRYVAFQSSASNLVSGDTNGAFDIFLKDLASGVTTRVSTDSSAVQGNSYSYDPSVSGDGRYVAFYSSASNLVSGDANGTSDIFVKDLIAGVTTRVSTDSSAVQGNSSSQYPSISGDGRYVAFESLASNLVSGDANGYQDIFVKDLASGVTTRASTNGSAGQGNSDSSYASINGDGRYVAFASSASNLVSGDTNGSDDIFVKDLISGVTTRVSADTSAVQGNGSSLFPSISGDGRCVAFQSYASNLVSGDTNGTYDIFVRDLVSGVTTRVSTDNSAVEGNGDSSYPSISGDGRYVAFQSHASNLAPWDTTTLDVFRVSNFIIIDNHPGPATIGLFDPSASAFYLRNSNSAGAADCTFGYGDPTQRWRELAGDWDGDGLDTVGLFDPATATWCLRNSLSAGVADWTFGYGDPSLTHGQGDSNWVPLVGDWDGDGTDTVGLFDPATCTWYLRNSISTGVADWTFGYGDPKLSHGHGDANWLPIVGDWDGNGTDTIGFFDPATCTWHLRNSLSAGVADYTVAYGDPSLTQGHAANNWQPIVGDWDWNHQATVGFYAPETSTFMLRNSLTSGMADLTFGYGEPGAGWRPVVGCWSAGAEQARAVDQIALDGAASLPQAGQRRSDAVDAALRQWDPAVLHAAALARPGVVPSAWDQAGSEDRGDDDWLSTGH